MPFAAIRFLAGIIIESHIVAVFLGWILYCNFTTFIKRNDTFLNVLNLIGVTLALLVLIDEVYIFISNNYNINWWDIPYWNNFHLMSIMAYLTVIIIFYKEKRRKNIIWTINGMLLFMLIKLLEPFESALIRAYYGLPFLFSFRPVLFDKMFWWFVLSFTVIFLGLAGFIAYKKRSELFHS